MLVSLLAALALTAPTLSRVGLLRNPLEQPKTGLDDDGLPLSPGPGHWLGTDNLGRDVLARVVHGARVSLAIGTAAMITAALIGVVTGLLAGFYGGRVDLVLMRFTEMNMTIPAILLAVAFAGLMDGRVLHLAPAEWHWTWLDLTLRKGLFTLFVIIGLVCWPGMVRVVRAQVLGLKEREFVQAARVLGATDRRLLFRHLLPNLLPTVIVLAAMCTANTILLEAGLGYLGLGVPPPAPTWGGMIFDGQPLFTVAPHIVVAPGVAIVLTVLGFNLLGQGLQEVLDPKRLR